MRNFYKGMQVLVTGGAGFIGSHLVDRLVEMGSHVTVVDNFITGDVHNLDQVKDRIQIIEEDVSKQSSEYLTKKRFELIFHLASPASPKNFKQIPVEIYKVNSWGTHFLCEYASQHNSRILYTSTSEAYGDPKEHPQNEEYWGNVNPVGPRSPYDVSKRFGEMVLSTFMREFGLDGRIVRIFNTYGPRMKVDDGRMLPTFINQSLNNISLSVHGDGKQTRSFCYVDDLVEYILRIMSNDRARGEVINIGNPDEHSVLEMAKMVKKMTGSNSQITFVNRPKDDPQLRRPDISKAMKIVGYSPTIEIEEGLLRTITYFKNLINHPIKESS